MNSSIEIFIADDRDMKENSAVIVWSVIDPLESTNNNCILGAAHSPFPIEMDTFRSTCHILLVSTGVPLNLFIAIVIMAFKRLHNKPRNVLWLGVTFCNLFTLLTILIEFLAYHMQNALICLIFVSITGVAYTCLLFNLLLALIDRYAAIVHPLWHRQKVTVRWVVVGQSISFIFVVLLIKFPFIAHFSLPECDFYPVHAKIIAVCNFILFVLCIVAQTVVYHKTRQCFNSSQQRGDSRETTVTFVQSGPKTQRRDTSAEILVLPSSSTQSDSQLRRLPEAIVNINSPSANDNNQASLCTTSPVTLRRHHVGGNRQMEVEATWSLLMGVFSLLIFTFPTLVMAFIEWGCRMIYGEDQCPPLISIIMFYARELLLGHLVYNPVMYMIRNREFSSTVREKCFVISR